MKQLQRNSNYAQFLYLVISVKHTFNATSDYSRNLPFSQFSEHILAPEIHTCPYRLFQTHLYVLISQNPLLYSLLQNHFSQNSFS